MNPLESLPDSLVQALLSMLPPTSLHQLRAVSSTWKANAIVALEEVPSVIVLGGLDAGEADTDTVFRLSWVTMRWLALPSLRAPCMYPAAAALDDGSIVVVYTGHAEALVPGMAAWQALPLSPACRFCAKAAPLPGRRMLLCGGWQQALDLGEQELVLGEPLGSDDAFVLTLGNSSADAVWHSAPPMRYSRCYHAAVSMPSGHVVVVGGETPSTPEGEVGGELTTAGHGLFTEIPATSEVFDPVSCCWREGKDDDGPDFLPAGSGNGRLKTIRSRFALAVADCATGGPPTPYSPYDILAIGGLGQGKAANTGHPEYTKDSMVEALETHVGTHAEWYNALARANGWPIEDLTEDEDDAPPSELYLALAARPAIPMSPRERERRQQRWTGLRMCGWSGMGLRVRRENPAACTVRGCVILCGGEGHSVLSSQVSSASAAEDLDEVMDEVALLDSCTGRWLLLPKLPEPRHCHAMVAAAWQGSQTQSL